MKRITPLFAIVLLAVITSLSSCSKDATPPTIEFVTGTDYTSSDITVPVNTTFKVGISAKSGSSALVNLLVTATSGSTPITLLDSTFSNETFTKDFMVTSPPEAGSIILTFKITDKEGQSAEVSLTLTATGSSINTYTAVLLGGQLNPGLGSFYSTFDNSVMKLAIARANSDQADMVFYYGTTNKASIVAISDAQLLDVPEFVECKNWTTRNATQFKLTFGLDWSAVTTESDVIAAATNFTATHINGLKVDDIVAFETASTSNNPGKKGMYKVLEINGTSGADRSIKIEVKIQK